MYSVFHHFRAMVYVQMDRKTLESIRSQIDSGALLGRYWNA